MKDLLNTEWKCD